MIATASGVQSETTIRCHHSVGGAAPDGVVSRARPLAALPGERYAFAVDGSTGALTAVATYTP
jgi:hypothetical protein